MIGLEETWFERILTRIQTPKKWNDKEQLIIDILSKICELEDTEIKVAPVTGRYFIVNKRLEYWIRINEHEVSITNHRFTLNYIGIGAFHYLLTKIVAKQVEKQRDEFEKTVFQNEVELLENIKGSIG